MFPRHHLGRPVVLSCLLVCTCLHVLRTHAADADAAREPVKPRPVGSPKTPTPPRPPIKDQASAPDPISTRFVKSVPARVPFPAPTNSVIIQAPYTLNVGNIIRMIFQRNPSVRAAREEMLAAHHGLDEFRANLSRFEPFVETRSDLSEFPNRRGAFGDTVETVVGVKKESFEGAVYSLESGGSYSHFRFNQYDLGRDPVESGGGALVRARVEMPFFGSRRRQDRIISQAFQESTARKAQLDYLKNYRSIVAEALSYYTLTVYYQRLVEIYQRYVDELLGLRGRELVKGEDLTRLETVMGSGETTRNLYQVRRHEYLSILLSYIAVAESDEFQVDVPEYRLSPLAEGLEDSARVGALVKKARENNPTFRVLDDAKRNAELQRTRAIKGRYDVTTFLEGTLFPLGSESFDNRFEGWTVAAGLNIRLNDHRVLDSSKLKAEAQIRQFEAQIEAEETLMRRRILTETQGLVENDRNRKQMLEVIAHSSREYEERLGEYRAGRINIDQLLQSRGGIASAEANLASNLYSSADREANLLLALGNVYEIVGLRLEDAEGVVGGGKGARSKR